MLKIYEFLLDENSLEKAMELQPTHPTNCAVAMEQGRMRQCFVFFNFN